MAMSFGISDIVKAVDLARRLWRSVEIAEEPLQDGRSPNLLSFDRRGIRGYSSLLILRRQIEDWELEDLGKEDLEAEDNNSANPMLAPSPLPLACHHFDFMCGTSTGGLIAITLGRLLMAMPEALEAYHDLGRRSDGAELEKGETRGLAQMRKDLHLLLRIMNKVSEGREPDEIVRKSIMFMHAGSKRCESWEHAYHVASYPIDIAKQDHTPSRPTSRSRSPHGSLELEKDIERAKSESGTMRCQGNQQVGTKQPGSGLDPSYSVPRSVLSDALALVRGDRHHTAANHTPAILTDWGCRDDVSSSKDARRRSALMMAVKAGDAAIVEELLKAGADLENEHNLVCEPISARWSSMPLYSDPSLGTLQTQGGLQPHVSQSELGRRHRGSRALPHPRLLLMSRCNGMSCVQCWKIAGETVSKVALAGATPLPLHAVQKYALEHGLVPTSPDLLSTSLNFNAVAGTISGMLDFKGLAHPTTAIFFWCSIIAAITMRLYAYINRRDRHQKWFVAAALILWPVLTFAMGLSLLGGSLCVLPGMMLTSLVLSDITHHVMRYRKRTRMAIVC